MCYVRGGINSRFFASGKDIRFGAEARGLMLRGVDISLMLCK